MGAKRKPVAFRPRQLATPEQEATKIQTVLPYLEKVLAKARGKAE